MKIEEIFTKDIERPINGVIKADDAQNLEMEVNEYVLTQELSDNLNELLDAYTEPENANGVWISGFFGSGKSHLLKMLAHLLGDVPDQDYDRKKVVDAFVAKTNQDNVILTRLIKKSGAIPAKSLLFNIDAKDDSSSRKQTDSLFRVFVKVFNEARGYFGTKPYVAKFEHDLDRAGQLEAFKAAYERISGISWEEGRKQDILQEGNVQKAYAEITGNAQDGPDKILTKYRDTYSISIEEFASEVKEWLDTQTNPETRLNFFVDEVGQFIGSDTKLMLSLQTIAETLNTKCGRRAWVFVTSQEDMEGVLGDPTKDQANDFSKIRDRFATKLKLTSTNVEEVIEKRLLEKTDNAKSLLTTTFDQHKDSFSTLFGFRDESKTYEVWEDSDSFANMYPFVPFQFKLFQDALLGLSSHNIFEGRHSSVGERSMLSVVQIVVQNMAHQDLDHLVPFDALFAGLTNTINSREQRSINHAESEMADTPLAARLLKALFLVKYVEHFKATPANLKVLLCDGFDTDLSALDKQIKTALNALERQNFVQRNGELYSFLTNEEQDIEREIKNVDVDENDLNKQLREFILSSLNVSKVRFDATAQDFECGFMLDDVTYGPAKPLTLHVFSPHTPYTKTEIVNNSDNIDELRLIMPKGDNLMEDMKLVLQTEKYVKLRDRTSMTKNQGFIVDLKTNQKEDAKRQLSERVAKALSASTMVFQMKEVATTATDPQSRLKEAFQKVIPEIFYQICDMEDMNFTESTPYQFANPAGDTFDDPGLSNLDNLADEVKSFIENANRDNRVTSVQNLVDNYTAKPYGWSRLAIGSLVGYLVGKHSVRLTLDGKQLSAAEAGTALQNTKQFDRLRVDLKESYEPSKVKDFSKFVTDFINDLNVSIPEEPEEIVSVWKENVERLVAELDRIIAEDSWPFTDRVRRARDQLAAKANESVSHYFKDFQAGDELLDLRDSLITPIMAFLNGSGAGIFREAVTLLQKNQDNLNYLDGEPRMLAKQIEELLDDPNVFRGSKPTQLLEFSQKLQAAITDKLTEEHENAATRIKEQADRLRETSAWISADTESQQQAERTIEEALNRARNATSIASCRQAAEDLRNDSNAILDSLARIQSADESTEIQNEKPQYINMRDIHLPNPPAEIRNEAELDDYLAILREAILAEINVGKYFVL